MVKTPVAFFVFNRPTQTARVFDAIRNARPARLLIVADGPRPDKVGEEALCGAVREIVERIDWDCAVERCYADTNMGCRARVSSGLDWVFSRCKEAIILEDDCLPDPSFFPYCEALLARYRDDPRVMMISGNNFIPDAHGSRASYRFSAYAHVWGWASWARAWQNYDVNMSDWPSVRRAGTFRDLNDGFTEAFWTETFDSTHSGAINTWDFQWVYACLKNGVSIVPNINLITNIGFGAGATHHEEANHLADLPSRAMEFPIRHPRRVKRERRADMRTFSRVFRPKPTLKNRLSRALRNLLRPAARAG